MVMLATKELYRGIYRIPSARKRNWNYANDGQYYITIVTAQRRELFGKIEDGEMYLNPYGQIAYDEFFKSFEIRKELFLGEFVIMPNHIHAIVHIDNEKNANSSVETHGRASQNNGETTVKTTIQTHGRASLQQNATNESPIQTHGRASLQPEHWSLNHSIDHSVCFREPKSLSSFVGDFKSSTLCRIDDWIDANGIDPSYKYNRNKPLWQTRFYDRIIRDGYEYQRIANYIKNNPQNWPEDSINPINPMELDVPDNLFM